jgi:hypothetical protein
VPNYTAVDGVGLTASTYNANVRDQVITTCLSSARPTGTIGQKIFETDTLLEYTYSGSGWVQTGGLGAWTTYTPVLTQSGAVAKTVTYAKYIKLGRLCIVNMRLDVTGTGTANNVITVSAPFTAAYASTNTIGSGWVYATNIFPGIASQYTTTSFALWDATQVTGVLHLGQAGTAVSGALGAGHGVSMHVAYETAA